MGDYARALVTLDDIKGILKKDTLEAIDSDLLDNIIIPGLSAAVERYLGRKIFETESTEYYDGTGTDIIKLRQYPVKAASVTVKLLTGATYASASYGYTMTENTEYIVDYEAGLLEAPAGTFERGKRLYQVKYTCGWAIDDIPQDIKLAINLWCAILFEKIGDKLFGVDTHQIGEAITTYFHEEIPIEVRALLARHKRGPRG